MLSSLYKSTLMTFVLLLILCGLYPLSVTLLAKVLFKEKAEGSLILKNNQVVGSELLGQNFSDPKYFQGRPSAAGDKGYDAANSSGTNLGPTSQKLADNLNANIKKVLEENPGVQPRQIPVDLVTTSASGLDPHISPEAAYLQATRISAQRQIPLAQVNQLIGQETQGPQWGLFGEARVNVLRLNLALDLIQH
ncbi:MAG: potassium-transporting ATPase subunit KdpC [Deltaproteobacteria bacterium]|nr:potassium-transporting ATPase subunit KdpC [Deltaproteobacteria bacterium]